MSSVSGNRSNVAALVAKFNQPESPSLRAASEDDLKGRPSLSPPREGWRDPSVAASSRLSGSPLRKASTPLHKASTPPTLPLAPPKLNMPRSQSDLKLPPTRSIVSEAVRQPGAATFVWTEDRRVEVASLKPFFPNCQAQVAEFYELTKGNANSAKFLLRLLSACPQCEHEGYVQSLKERYTEVEWYLRSIHQTVEDKQIPFQYSLALCHLMLLDHNQFKTFKGDYKKLYETQVYASVRQNARNMGGDPFFVISQIKLDGLQGEQQYWLAAENAKKRDAISKAWSDRVIGIIEVKRRHLYAPSEDVGCLLGEAYPDDHFSRFVQDSMDRLELDIAVLASPSTMTDAFIANGFTGPKVFDVLKADSKGVRPLDVMVEQAVNAYISKLFGVVPQ